MAQSAALIVVLKRELKARGVRYADLAKRLKLSEASVKRMFAGRTSHWIVWTKSAPVPEWTFQTSPAHSRATRRWFLSSRTSRRKRSSRIGSCSSWRFVC